ncbi:PQQ-binding-like beta-propeller repeat protein [Aquincola sp. J276]|uniref:outer membrane protein assembly factor BamB family protein n=1 Tax=Aquincola sp. J276 TaxID=2898432 RepID=UPI0021515045|nr:PQQ-binding-like beta-propeller repeat protein [Aquincola sp. J276]MCR5864160.1 PQQ-binding-like beta-propeller repeat protein [Aquincola sp. J276]
MMKLSHITMAALMAMAACGAAAVLAQPAPSPSLAPAGSNWPLVHGNLGSQGYSSLTQINKGNIRSLGPAWVVHTNVEPVTQPAPGPGSSDVGQQTTPVVVDGVMYLDTPGGGVMALNAATGAVKWKWMPSVEANGYGGNRQHRGVSVGEGKVFTTAAGGRMVALNQQTGAVEWAVVPTYNGTAIGGIAKVATIYQDGMVYQGTNDNGRGAMIAVRASDGAVQWVFYSAYPHGTSFTDVNGNTFDAGDTWTTRNTPNDTPNDCYLNGGGASWIHPSIDTQLGMLYVTFGNPRSCTGAQWGGDRPGDNLFTSSLVALDMKTGAYKWHFQSVKHDVWDMDNVHTPSLADVQIGGQTRKVIYYGSKSGHQFVLDRTNGKPALPVVYRQVPTDARQAQPATQPFPASGPFQEQCLVYQNLGSEIPGAPNRAVPNWNGYQAQPDPEKPGQYKLVLNPDNYLKNDTQYLSGTREGCMYDPHWDENSMFLSMTSQNGAADWSNVSISPKLNMRYIGMSYNPVAHGAFQGGNGLRQIGGYQTGGVVAVDASTNLPVWRKHFGLGGDVAHGNHPLVTASDLLFINRVDGWLMGLDAQTGEELWRFQTGAPSASGVVTYTVGGEQYIAMPAMAGTQPYAQQGQGAAVWAFKLGGKAVYTTGPRSNPVVVSGSSEAPAPVPIANLRRPVNNTPATGLPANTIYLARSDGTATATKDSVTTASMVPSTLTVPVGTTVTFTNPGDATFGVPGSGNLKAHCATQYFEGRFNFKLQPGQSAQHKFDREGEYYYNDCTDPRPTGKVVVTLAAQEQPGALQFTPGTLNLRPANGVFTSVQGLVTATFKLPAGHTLDGQVELKTPLTMQTFPAVSARATSDGRTLVVTFDKALVDNNIPEGSAVPLTVSANVLHQGVQKKLTSTATVRVVK